jgi:hypothetical protein
MTLKPASEKQIDFVRDLLVARDCSAELSSPIEEALEAGTLSSSAASDFIDTALKLPRVSKAEMSSSSPMQLALAGLPKSKYAIHVDYLDVTNVGHTVHGDYLFVEIREYNGYRYMRRLQGSVGGFTRIKMSLEDVVDVTNALREDSYSFAKKFGEIYSCCAKCGAELTDPVSREMYLGPTCRKEFAM